MSVSAVVHNCDAIKRNESLFCKAIKVLCSAENPIKIGLAVPKIQTILSD